MTLPGVDVAHLVDSTVLKQNAGREEIEALCREASELAVATVFVQPVWVELSVELLAGTQVGVGTVAGFPLGGSLPEIKAASARESLVRGAREIDFVINLGALIDGDLDLVAHEMRLMAETVRGRGTSKSIIEYPLLSPHQIRTVCRMAVEAGIDFVKTCTGFGPRGVRPEDVRFLREILPPNVAVKASGGIRDLAQARALVAAGAARVGTSSAGRNIRGEKAP